MWTRIAVASVLAVGVTTGALHAQYGRGNRQPADVYVNPAKYDGRFTFARLQYTTGPGGYYYRGSRGAPSSGGIPAWAHGYPESEVNLIKILQAVSLLDVKVDVTAVVAPTDPDLFKYPVVYMTEAGYMVVNNPEAEALRVYMQKGGFIIVDDFRDDFNRGNNGWANFMGVMDRVMPGGKFLPLDGTHPIFHSFFEIPHPEAFIAAYDRIPPQYYGLFENNDPTKRMMMMVNFNNDVSEYWETSSRGVYLVALANEGFKLGVNYIMYGITH
jgi:hypothetical protein